MKASAILAAVAVCPSLNILLMSRNVSCMDKLIMFGSLMLCYLSFVFEGDVEHFLIQLWIYCAHVVPESTELLFNLKDCVVRVYCK